MNVVCSIPLNSETVLMWINKNLHCYSVISISDANLKQMGEAHFGMEKSLPKIHMFMWTPGFLLLLVSSAQGTSAPNSYKLTQSEFIWQTVTSATWDKAYTWI